MRPSADFFGSLASSTFALRLREYNRWICAGANAPPFGTLPSATSHIPQPLDEIVSKRFIAEEDSREWQGICTPKNLKTSDKVSVEVLDFVRDKKKADYYKVEKIPATVVEGEEDYGLRFYGIPGGYEFASLIHALKAVSSRDSALSTGTNFESN